MTKALITGLALVALLSGCVFATEGPRQPRKDSNDYVCVKEKKTGTIRTTKVCYPKERSETQKEQTRQDMKRIQGQTY